ncbi:hypothetical protein SAMN03159338_0342 [Sphingomonas sp. NFR04]|uniref:hypothetical protein n=1 Tax=Sphingomonas sp. NFR04 TaxID=1566283 RepID=UPI0008EA6D9B|nr:hypothetical protein [Sphingomonas sp. NFR04]SFI93154.1 hypothetical protein SAMN03159338_0342 [Sphingomonas sp. NFR04]
MRSLPLLAVGAALLTGCAQPTTRYPSLLPRANEGLNFTEPERPIPQATPDAALDARIAALTAAIESADRDFQTAAKDAEAKVTRAHGQAAGTSPWLDAQTALSVLDGLRSRTAVTLADMDQLRIERAQSGQPDYPALQTAMDRGAAIVAAQESRARALEAAIAPG